MNPAPACNCHRFSSTARHADRVRGGSPAHPRRGVRVVSGQPGPRRIVLSVVATTAALVLLFSYRTSFGGSVPS